jgi:hypothetical protein
MNDERSNGDSLPEVAQSNEPDEVGHDITSLTRRGFLAGAGSIMGAYSTGAFAETEPTHGWLIYRAPDTQTPGRSVIGIAYRAEREEPIWCFLPEVSFGEYAKATIQPLSSTAHKNGNAYDAQVVFSGLELWRPDKKIPNYFSLIFRFIHPIDKKSPESTAKKPPDLPARKPPHLAAKRPSDSAVEMPPHLAAKKPSDPAKKPPHPTAEKRPHPSVEKPSHPSDEQSPRVEIVAHNLLSTGEERTLARLDLATWHSKAPFPVSDVQVAPALLDAVFSSHLRLPRSGKTTLFLVMPTEHDRRLIWRFCSSGSTHASGFAIVADHNAKLSDSEFSRAVLGSSASLDMWRAHAAIEKDAGSTQALVAAPASATAPPQAPATATDKAPKPTAPRTIARLTEFQPNSFRVVLGENKLTNGQVNSLVLEDLVAARPDRDDDRPVQLVRRDTSGYPNCIKFEDNQKAAEAAEAGRIAPPGARPGKMLAASATPAECFDDEDKTGSDASAHKNTLFLPAVIETTLPVAAGELAVCTSRAKKTARQEGPFRLGEGTLTLSGPPDGSPLRVDADFQLCADRISLLTAFGPFEIERPEDKRVRRRDALVLSEENNDGTKASQYELRRPVRLSVTDRVVRAFEATARVCGVGVALNKPASATADPLADDPQACRVDLGFPQGCEVLFRLFGLDDSANTRQGIGRLSLGTAPDAQPTKGAYAGPYVLPLDSGVLQLRRWRDLVCLTYRFAGLDLVQDNDGKAYLVPRGLAQQRSFDRPAKAADGQFADPDMSAASFDPRAMMVVEFPSQHVAEEAFFEQRKAKPVPPRYPASVLQDNPVPAKTFDKLRRLYLSQNPRAKPLPDGASLDAKAKERICLRRKLLKAIETFKEAQQKAHPDLPAKADVVAFDNFLAQFESVKKDLTREQQLYVGDEFLDPAARRMAEIAADKLIIAKADFFDALPDDPVSHEDIAATVTHLQELKSKDQQTDTLHNAVVAQLERSKDSRDKLDGPLAQLVTQADPILNKLRSSRDPFFVAVQQAYQDQSKNIRKFTNQDLDKLPETFTGRTPLRDAVEKIRQKIEADANMPGDGDKAKAIRELAKKQAPILDDFSKTFVRNIIRQVQGQLGLTGDENPTPLSRARLSGPSRLAFRINTDDFETGDQGGRIEFSASELTNWSRHELVVIRRAQKLLKAYADGSRRPLWDMQENHDLAAQLLYQGFSRGGWDTSKSQNTNKGPRNWSEGTVTAEQRLAEVAASAAAPPGPFETAIELPFRLFLSPSQDGRFRTRRNVPPWLLSKRKDDARKAPHVEPHVEPLWRASFVVEPNSALRAVWSPDFRPEAFVPGTIGHGTGGSVLPCPSRTNRPPMRGPYAPWALGRETSDNPIPRDIGEAPRFRTSLDAFDRHELVALSSLHGLPVIGKVGTDAQGNTVRLGKDQVEPPEGFQVSTPNWEDVDDDNRRLLPTLNDVYLPNALDPKGLELALSSLGGFLRVNASFDPPASILTGKGDDYYNALSIERWRHNIVLGRDISAEVVYKGYLFPIGLHCTLIKITERRFQHVDGRNGPVAVLRQRMFLRVGNPIKNFPAFQQPDAGRRLPFRMLTVVTTQTPDIVDPYDVSGGTDEHDIYPNGRIQLGRDTRGTAFWPRTTKRLGGEVKFDLLVDGNIPTRLPLIFVDNAAANNKDAVQSVCRHYNKLSTSSASTFTPALTQAGFGGAKLTYAPESKAGDTQFETQSVVFGAEGRTTSDPKQGDAKDYRPFSKDSPTPFNANFVSDPFMQGADQPPFYPAMRFATVKIGQIERLVAHPLPPTRVAYDPSYALWGFPGEDDEQANGPQFGSQPGRQPRSKSGTAGAQANPKEIFLSTINPPKLTFGQAGDKGGAVSRPEMTVHALSRKAGPISANPETPTTPAMAPAAGQPSSDPDPDKPNAITDRLNELAKNPDPASALAQALFGSDATLLGLIKLSDLVKAIMTLASDRVPVLHELVEYGGGLAGDADALIKERVLEPLQQALAAIKTPMENDVDIGGAKTVKVQDIYPDVVTSYLALTNSVQAAIAAPPPAIETAASETISVYTAVYTAGRGFVNAIERALRDPITPLREAAKTWLNNETEEFRNQLDKKLGELQTKILDNLTESPRAFLRHQAVDHILKPLKSAIFAMPPPANPGTLPSTTPWADLTDVLNKSLDKALDDDSVWPSSGNTFFDADEFASRVAWHVRHNTENKIDAKLTDLQASALEQIAAADTTAAVATAATAADTVVADMAANDLLLPAVRIFLTKSKIGEYSQGLTGLKITDTDGLKRLFSLAGDASGAIEALRPLINIGTAFRTACKDSVAPLTNLIKAALPSTFALPDAAVFDRLSRGLMHLLIDATNKISFGDSPVIQEDTRQALNNLRNILQDTIEKTQKQCKAIFSDLTDLTSTLTAFEAESANFVANICRSDQNPQLSWQLQRLLNYVRRLSMQAGRCVGNAQSLMSTLSGVLHDDAKVLFRALATKPWSDSDSVSTAPKDPNAWSLPTSSADYTLGPDQKLIPNSNEPAVYLLDLLRKRFFYLVIAAVQESAKTVQAVSLAGVAADPKTRGAAFDALIKSVRMIVGDRAPYKQILDVGLPNANTVGGRLKKAIDDLNNDDAAKKFITFLDKNNSLTLTNGSDFASGANKFIDASTALAAVAVEVIDKVVGDGINDALGDPKQPIQAFLAAFLDRVAGQFEDDANNAIKAIADFIKPFVENPLADIYAVFLANRDSLYDQILGMQDIGPVATQVATALLAPKDADSGDNDASAKKKNDALAKQNGMVVEIKNNLDKADKRLDELINLCNLVKSWADTEYKDPKNLTYGPNAVLYIANQAKDVVANLLRDVLKGDIGKIIDFAAIKADVERRLRELIPTKVTLAYDFDTELQPVLGIFLPEEGSRLTLKARTVIDVLNGGPPQISSSGQMGPFRVKILGGVLDIVTLSFDGAKFGSDTGGKLKANVIDVQLGEAVSFLQAVSSFFSFGANGFYLSVLFDPPGIEAGYRMPPCGFALGVLGVSNISLNAAAILPFDSSPALFKVGISRPEAPFLINVAVYGGGGHLALYSTSQGIIGFEASFEFGAVVAFAIGPLTGNARITVGVFLRSFRDTTTGHNLSTIEGYTTVAGSASISIFRFSAMLQVRVGQQPNGEMVGTAIFTFSFSMGIKDIEFRVTARKSMGKGYSSNPQISDAGDTADPLSKLVQLASNLPAGAVASDVPGGPHTLRVAPRTQHPAPHTPHAAPPAGSCEDEKKPSGHRVATLNYCAVCKGENYAKYQSYFDHCRPWQPEFF